MMNLIRLDFMRILKSKSTYVVLGVLGLIVILTGAFFFMFTNQDALNWLIKQGFIITSNITNAGFSDLSDLDYIAGTALNGGICAVISGIYISLFISLDFHSGYIKNILAFHSKRWKYFASKLLCLSLFNLVQISFITGLAMLIKFLFRLPFTASAPADYLWYFLSIWAIQIALNALMIFIIMLTRSQGVGIAAAIIILGGLISVFLEQIASFFGLSIRPYSLLLALQDCPTGFQTNTTVHIFIVSIGWFLIYAFSGLFFLYKKDIS